jgi:hypothetical protein
VVSDLVTVPIPADMPRGPARIIVGLYDLPTGARLPVSLDGELVRDYAVVGELGVE